MNSAHWHLVVNHIPIVFPMVGILVMFTGLLVKSGPIKRTSYFIFTLGSVAAIVAMTTGEGAEDVVEKMAGVSERSIETHEEAAELFSTMSYILGALSLVGLWASLKQKAAANTLNIVALMFAIVLVFFASRTGTTGGEIQHIEIRDGTVLPAELEGMKDDEEE